MTAVVGVTLGMYTLGHRHGVAETKAYEYKAYLHCAHQVHKIYQELGWLEDVNTPQYELNILNCFLTMVNPHE